MKRGVIAAILASLLLSGCSAHVNTAGSQISGTTQASYEGVYFQVPDVQSISFADITAKMYNTIEEQDAAKRRLINETITGTTDNGYLLTSSHDFICYVSKSSNSFESVNSTNPRDDMLALVDHADIDFVNYGRYIANADEVDKAVLRVDFRVENTLGESVAYSGYLGAFNKSGVWYYYLAGYRNADASDLKLCFNMVRSMS